MPQPVSPGFHVRPSRPILPRTGHDGALLRCYTCMGIATLVDGTPDPLASRALWPDLPCPITPGCTGQLVPEALN